MSATLTWFNSGLGTKTGTGVANLIDDIVALVNSKSGDANFSWAVASSNNAGTPYYIVLKPKSGAAGRVLLVNFTSLPANNNAAILSGNPTANATYCYWFPNGNVDTPSNLTAASGTILGNDTGATKDTAPGAIGTIYGASFQPFYFDSAEAIWIGFQNPASSIVYAMAAGKIVVDANDVAYDGSFGSGSFSLNNFGNAANPTITWVTPSTSLVPTVTTARLRVNYGTNNKAYFQGLIPNVWNSQAADASDMLVDSSLSKVWFVPAQLLGHTKGEGFALKLRQVAYGPGFLAAFSAYSSTGPVIQARVFNAASAGNATPWFTNFKI